VPKKGQKLNVFHSHNQSSERLKHVIGKISIL